MTSETSIATFLTEIVMGVGTECRKGCGDCSCGARPRYWYRYPGMQWVCGNCHMRRPFRGTIA